MGPSARPVLTRAASALALAAVVAFPLQGSRTIESPAAEAPVAVAADYQAAAPDVAVDVLSPDMPLPQVFADNEAKVSFVAPAGWVRGPASALNPVSDPPEPVLELVRYQLRLSDTSLYAAPIPITIPGFSRIRRPTLSASRRRSASASISARWAAISTRVSAIVSPMRPPLGPMRSSPPAVRS